MFFMKWMYVSYGLKHFSFQGNEPVGMAAKELLWQDLTVIVL